MTFFQSGCVLTSTTIGAILTTLRTSIPYGRCLIVVPKPTTMTPWIQELKLFPKDWEKTTYVWDSKLSKKERIKMAAKIQKNNTETIVLVAATMLKNLKEHLPEGFEWDYIVADEAHRFKKTVSENNTTSHAAILREVVQYAKKVILVTGKVISYTVAENLTLNSYTCAKQCQGIRKSVQSGRDRCC